MCVHDFPCVTDGCVYVVHMDYYFYFFNLIPSTHTTVLSFNKILIITITAAAVCVVIIMGRY